MVEILPTDIISWSVNLSVDQGPTATIELENSAFRYDVMEMLNQPIEILASDDNTTYTRWFRGLISGLDPTYELASSRNVALTCVSFFNRLARKPANTERYGDSEPYKSTGGATGQQLLEELVGSYGCYSSGFYDFTSASGTLFSKIAISEGSLSDAIKKVAMACQQELFISKDGKLITDPFVTNADTLDIDLDDGLVQSAKKIISNELGFSRVRVRARYLDFDEKYGSSLIFEGEIEYEYDPRVGDNSQRATVRVDSSSTPPEILQNALVVAYNPAILGIVIETTEIGIMYLRFAVSGIFATPGTHRFVVHISASGTNSNEADGLGNSMHPVLKGRASHTVKATHDRFMNARVGRSPIYHSIKPVDEKEENRIEAYVQDNGLYGEIGVVWEEIDNPYIPTYEIAVVVGQRHIIEFLQSRVSWDVTCQYDKNMNINKKIGFVVPDTDTGTGDSIGIVGVTRSLSIRYAAEGPDLSMSFVAEELAEATVTSLRSATEDDISNMTADEIFLSDL